MVINTIIFTYNCSMRISGEKKSFININTHNVITWRDIRNMCNEIK